MEPILLLFSSLGLLYLLKFDEYSSQRVTHDSDGGVNHLRSWWNACLAATFLTLAITTKFVGIYSACLAVAMVSMRFWNSLNDSTLSDQLLIIRGLFRFLVFGLLPIAIYLGIFWIHLSILHRAGPHDMVMTSAFQV